MPPPRFFVDASLAAGRSVRLPADVAHHALRVLRLRDEAPIVLFNGEGGEYRATLHRQGADVLGQIVAFDPVERESPLSVTLVQALVAVDKLDWIVEKSTELGAERLIVAATRRSVVQLDEARSQRRLAHWRDIARAACCQCGRNRIPAVDYFPSLPAALAAVPECSQRLLLTPAASSGLPTRLTGQPVTLLVGPEGGVSDEEAMQAEAAGFIATRFGPRILRTETAGLAALAALQAIGGDFAGPCRG